MISKVILKDIQLSRPLISEDLRPFGEGFNFHAYLIDEDEVLLVAKDEEAADKVPVVRQVLKALSSRVTLDIPQVLTYAPKTIQHNGYYLLKRLYGEPLTPEIVESSPIDEQQQYLEQLVQFLHEIHQFPLNLAQELGVIKDFEYPLFPYLIEQIDQVLIPALNHTEKEQILKIVQEAYEEKPPDNFLALVHGDLSPEHLFYSPERKTLTGVIDFADIQINDPDYDLMYLYQDYGKAFMMQLYPLYSQSNPDKLHNKIQFFNLLDQLAYIEEGMDEENQEQIDYGLDYLKYQLEEERTFSS